MMKAKGSILQNIFFISIFIFFSGIVDAKVVFKNIRCCMLENPVGVEIPTFSWQYELSKQPVHQTAWEIQIASQRTILLKGKADIWESGKIDSDKMFDIIPENVKFKDAQTYWWRVRVWDGSKVSSWSEPNNFTMGLLSKDSWKAKWITADWRKGHRLPYFRNEFKVKDNIEKAVVFFSGLGSGDLYINGCLADSTRILDPAQTNYEHYALYGTYDVTKMLNSGVNCIGVMLNDGWFNQDEAFQKFVYGDPMLILQMHVFYKDGSSDIVVSDENWMWADGPVVSANIYRGEAYDARYKIKDWSLPGLDLNKWKKSLLAKKAVPPVLKSTMAPAIRLHNVVSATKMWKTTTGWVYDFGVNNAYVPRLNINLPSGIKITLRSGEELNDDGTIDFRSSGIRVVPVQTDSYTTDSSGNQTWTARNTYHGFRYVEMTISDPTVKPEIDWLQAVEVHTALTGTGTFECSNQQINKLHELALRTFYANQQGVPVDCPHREKCGWLGDVHAYIKMALYNSDINNYLDKYMEDIYSGALRAEKRTLHHLHKNARFYQAPKASGIPYMIAPGKRLCGVASPDWGTALVQIPWHLYLYNGNTLVLEKYYDFMKQWTDYVSNELAIDNIVYHGLGDWCPPFDKAGIDTPLEFTSSAFHYYDLYIMEKVSALFNKSDDNKYYSQKKNEVKNAIISKFYNPLIKSFGSQTADAMALDLGIYPDGDSKKIAESLVLSIKTKDNFFYTGIFGLCRIGSALSRNGQAIAAWNAFTKTGNNSFAYMWDEAGATTLWEILPICKENEHLLEWRSHSHPMQGGFDAWFYEDLAGIRPCESDPGFKTVLFEPLWDVNLDWVKAKTETRYGSVKSDWKKDGKQILWEISVPNGATGLVAVPDGKNMYFDNGKLFDVKPELTKEGKRYFRLQSGNYKLLIK